MEISCITQGIQRQLCKNVEAWERVGGGRWEGGWIEGEGIYVHIWLIHVDVWQKSNQYCKTIISQLKINKFLKILFPSSIFVFSSSGTNC